MAESQTSEIWRVQILDVLYRVAQKEYNNFDR